MLINAFSQKQVRAPNAGFTLAEVLIATLVVAISFVGLYSGLVQGDRIIGDSAQNIRATEIMAQQTETLRLYTWDQLTNNGYIPRSFTNYFYPNNLTNGTAGAIYYGSLDIGDSCLTESYGNDLRQVTVTLTWNTSSGTHQRQMTTFVSHYGMQNYVYK